MGRPMRFRLVAAAVAVAATHALATSPARAQAANSVDVRALIEREARSLAGEGYIQAQPGISTRSARTQTSRFVLRLAEGQRYALVAACNQGCNHVDLALYDGRRTLLTRNAEKAAVVTVAGPAHAGGLYEVEVKLPGCRAPACDLAFAVLWQGKGQAPEPVVIASSAPLSPPAAAATAVQVPMVAGFSAQIERRPGQEMEANNYRQSQVASLEACEQMCLADRTCAALEFYRESRSCGLFRQVAGMRSARNIDAGIKRAR